MTVAIDEAVLGRRLVRDDDGIWSCRDAATVSYPAEGHDRCFEVEDGSFWFRHRNDCIVAAARRYPPPGGGAIVDVGGGNGYVSAGLARAGFDVVLVEPGRAGAENARRRGLERVICARIEDVRFDSASVPACGLFDVLEHVEDDRGFLVALRELLQPGGRLYLTVPAYRALWSRDDELAGHFRRYRLAGLTASLREAGFEVELASYFFRITPPAILALRTLPSRLGLARDRIRRETVRRDHLAAGRAGRWLRPLLAAEVTRIARGGRIAFGGSCLAVARRPLA